MEHQSKLHQTVNQIPICERTGEPMDLKWTSKWSDRLYLVFCKCGYVHEFVRDEPLQD